MWVGEGMHNEDVGRMENADKFLIISDRNPTEAEEIFTFRPPLLEGMTASWLLQLGLH